MESKLRALRKRDYLYPGMSEEEEAWYQGYNSSLEHLVDSERTIAAFKKLKVNMKNSYFNRSEDYSYDQGWNEAIGDAIELL